MEMETEELIEPAPLRASVPAVMAVALLKVLTPPKTSVPGPALVMVTAPLPLIIPLNVVVVLLIVNVLAPPPELTFPLNTRLPVPGAPKLAFWPSVTALAKVRVFASADWIVSLTALILSVPVPAAVSLPTANVLPPFTVTPAVKVFAPESVSEPEATVIVVVPLPGPLMILPLKVEVPPLKPSVALPVLPFWMVAPVAPGATTKPPIPDVVRPYRSSVAEWPLLDRKSVV